MTDSERLERGDIWSNKKGWQSRDEAGWDFARNMLPLYRACWNKMGRGDATDDEILDVICGCGLSPLNAVLGEVR